MDIRIKYQDHDLDQMPPISEATPLLSQGPPLISIKDQEDQSGPFLCTEGA